MKKNKKPTENRQMASIAPGMENDNLKVEASEEDIKNGNYTQVTRLSFDEVEPSVE